MNKKVLICGDLVWDTHIARLPYLNQGFSPGHQYSQMKNTRGGAWYLEEMIKFAIEAHNQEAAEPIDADLFAPGKIEDNKWPSGVARGFSVWKWFHEHKQDPGTWRISEFLGCQRASWDQRESYPSTTTEIHNPNILVIEDLGLGFAQAPDFWPECLTNKDYYPDSIIVKGGIPFDSPLMQTLLDPNSSLTNRVTLIFYVDYLRHMGGTISRGLSWDRTIEDLIREFSHKGYAMTLRNCKRVISFCGRSAASIFSHVPQSREHNSTSSGLQLERFIFDPNHFEDTWSSNFEGYSFGTGSMLTAAVVVNELLANKQQMFSSVTNGLTAARALHRHNGGHDLQSFEPFAASKNSFPKNFDTTSSEFQSVYPQDIIAGTALSAVGEKSSLLTDIVGSGIDRLYAIAEAIVKTGYGKALKGVPRLAYGKYFTVDREEIENLNTVRLLVEDYKISGDSRPLSIAIFGAPGSGKSFAIKQLAREIFGEQHATLEFNISQFNGIEDLHDAFQEVRDKSIQKQIPLVFWDEFDCLNDSKSEAWLRHFLAPMQDANFQVRGKTHLFGKCVFVFAGGRYDSFQKFDRSDSQNDSFKNDKGPDFVSRLRGYVNIKGPNLAGQATSEIKDDVCVIRRGLLLRSFLERHHPYIIHPSTLELNISSSLLAAFLNVKEYKHGARSMEAIVSLSHLGPDAHFGPSELPPLENIIFHVTPDFVQCLNSL